MATTLIEVLQFIHRTELSSHEHSRIVEALNNKIRAKRQEAKAAFYVGQDVTFYSEKQFRQVTGKVHKISRVNIQVFEGGNRFMRWTVSPGLLKPVETAKKTTGEDNTVTQDEF